MNDQRILLVFIILSIIATLGLYIWRAVKQVKNKNDERWHYVLLKAKQAVEIPYALLMLITAILSVIPSVQEVTFTVSRLIFIAILYFGLRNLIELLSLIYFEHNL